MTATLTTLTISVGIVFFIVGLLLRLIPPRKINSFYGYRTTSSMRNMDTWTTANKYSATIMIIVGLILTIIGLGTTFIPDTGATGTGVAIGLIIFSIIIMVGKTEKHSKKLFDKNGNRQQES